MSEFDSPDAPTRAPWHLWVVASFAILFTLFGAYDYTMSQLNNRSYLAATIPAGVSVEAVIAYFDQMPLWIVTIWAFGVWSAVGAAIVLVLRSRNAYPLFLLSLGALVIANGWTLANPMPEASEDPSRFLMSAVIFAIMLALTMYARAMRFREVLH